jgi:hypothetical protein
MNRLFFLLLTASLLPLFSFAQTTEPLPKSFVIGTYEEAYEEVVSDYQQSFLDICENDLQQGAELWLSLLQEMEAYADQREYNLKGVNIWFHVFFAADGSITHIGYYLKPDSRHVESAGMLEFLASFAEQYQLPRISDQPFANYSAASFPIVYNLLKRDKQN